MKITHCIGLDPGVSGAIAIVSSTLAYVVDIPTRPIRNSNGNIVQVIDLDAAVTLCREIIGNSPIGLIAFATEKSSTYNQAARNAVTAHTPRVAIEAILATLGVTQRFQFAPVTWKAAYKLSKNKAQSMALVQELYPGISLKDRATADRSEAILIARYGLHVATGQPSTVK